MVRGGGWGQLAALWGCCISPASRIHFRQVTTSVLSTLATDITGRMGSGTHCLLDTGPGQAVDHPEHTVHRSITHSVANSIPCQKWSLRGKPRNALHVVVFLLGLAVSVPPLCVTHHSLSPSHLYTEYPVTLGSRETLSWCHCFSLKEKKRHHQQPYFPFSFAPTPGP